MLFQHKNWKCQFVSQIKIVNTHFLHRSEWKKLLGCNISVSVERCPNIEFMLSKEQKLPFLNTTTNWKVFFIT